MDLGLLVENVPFVLLLAGFTCLAPLFRGRLKPLSRVLVALGFIVGIIVLVLAYILYSKGNYDVFTLGVLVVAGLLLFLRPIRNMRWAALAAFVVGLLAAYYSYSTYSVSTTVLIIVFVAATLLFYLVFKFAEDLLGSIGSILSFAPIAVIVGTVCVAQGLLLLMGQSLSSYIPPIRFLIPPIND